MQFRCPYFTSPTSPTWTTTGSIRTLNKTLSLAVINGPIECDWLPVLIAVRFFASPTIHDKQSISFLGVVRGIYDNLLHGLVVVALLANLQRVIYGLWERWLPLSGFIVVSGQWWVAVLCGTRTGRMFVYGTGQKNGVVSVTSHTQINNSLLEPED